MSVEQKLEAVLDKKQWRNHHEVHNTDQEQETKQQDAIVWREKVVWMMPKDNTEGRRWILFINSEFSSVSGSSVLCQEHESS